MAFGADDFFFPREHNSFKAVPTLTATVFKNRHGSLLSVQKNRLMVR